MYILFYHLGERSVSALPFHLFTWNSCTLRTWNLTSRSTMVHHKSSQCPDNSIIIFAYICDISLQHSTTFYNALPFGTWRKNIYTNQLPPNIENSFSCLGGFFSCGILYTSSFLRVRIRPHLPSFHTALQTAHQITVGTRGRQALSWGPRMPTEPRSPYGTGMGPVDDLWIYALISTRIGGSMVRLLISILVDLMGHLMGIITYHYHFQWCFKALWRYINKCISIPSLQTLHRGTDPTDFAEEILQPK